MKGTRIGTRGGKRDSSYKEVDIGRTCSVHSEIMLKKLRLECRVRRGYKRCSVVYSRFKMVKASSVTGVEAGRAVIRRGSHIF
jgi:hypothetical protein